MTQKNINGAAPARLVIATRESRLALWQAEHIKARLQALYPACQIELLGMTTRGDQILDRPLARIGGKGLFIKELETALLTGEADLAVHSMKDVPMQVAEPFTLACISGRDSALDAFVSSRYESLAEMPPGAVVGTSSLRREAQLHAQYPYLSVTSLRGNLDTRLAKLDRGEYDAIILACAGLRRLGLAERIREELPTTAFLPAVGQGALGIECLAARQELIQWLIPLADGEVDRCVRAERAVSASLNGSCEVPLGAHAHYDQADNQLWLRAFVARVDGQQILRAEKRGSGDDPVALGHAVAEMLREQGAEAILAAVR